MKKSATRENITFSPDTGLQEIRTLHLGMPKGGLLSASVFMRLSAVSPRSPEIYGSRVDTSGPYSRRYTSKYLFKPSSFILIHLITRFVPTRPYSYLIDTSNILTIPYSLCQLKDEHLTY